MSVWNLARGVLVGESSTSMSSRLRRARWQRLTDTFPSLADMAVLDLGGTVQNWSLSPVQPRSVTMVNPAPYDGVVPSGFEYVVGDACDLPQSIKQRTWDLVYSNSVIEHVGGHQRCKDFARSVRELAPSYWVQTPYRYFPIEPHWVFPFFQFFPCRARLFVASRWGIHDGNRASSDAIVDKILDVSLLGLTEMRLYFPDAHMMTERFAGLPKSIIAVRA